MDCMAMAQAVPASPQYVFLAFLAKVWSCNVIAPQYEHLA